MKMSVAIMTSDFETKIERDVSIMTQTKLTMTSDPIGAIHKPTTREALKMTSDPIGVTHTPTTRTGALKMTSDLDVRLRGTAQGAMPRPYEMNRVLRETLTTIATPSLFMKEYHLYAVTQGETFEHNGINRQLGNPPTLDKLTWRNLKH